MPGTDSSHLGLATDSGIMHLYGEWREAGISGAQFNSLQIK